MGFVFLEDVSPPDATARARVETVQAETSVEKIDFALVKTRCRTRTIATLIAISTRVAVAVVFGGHRGHRPNLLSTVCIHGNTNLPILAFHGPPDHRVGFAATDHKGAEACVGGDLPDEPRNAR